MAATDINNQIKAFRLQRFKEQMETYWDVDDVLFNVCVLFTEGASDNVAKNFYPYTFGGKYRLRNDDMDTIKPIDNQGADRKPYWLEWFDKDTNGNYYVNAAEGGFIKLIWDAYFTGPGSRGYTMMNRVLQGLETLGGSTVGMHLDRLMAWNEKYFNKVKDYFPATIVNDDMMRYERARIAANKGLYSEVDPLTQELGDHKSTENSWMKKRFIYLQSMFSYGDFAAGASGTITFRLLNPSTFTLTPAIAMYPSIAAGSTVVRGARTMEGNTCSLYVSGSDLDCSVLGAHYLSDIGDWHNVPIRNNPSFNARMLKELILGTPNATDPISLDITGLTLNCLSLRKLDIRNIRNLTGQIDLTGSSIINTVLAEGTQVSRFSFADGTPLTTLNLPEAYQQIVLRNMPMLINENINYMDCAQNVTRFLVSECPQMNPLTMLCDIIEAQKSQGENHALKRVYVDGFNEVSDNPNVIESLTELLEGYQAISRQESDLSGLPILSGTITMTCPVYEDTIQTLQEAFGAGGLVINYSSVFVRFEDPRVFEICAYNWGFTTDLQEVDGQGGVVDAGTLEANGDTLVYSDHVFCSSQAISAHSGIPATAASAHRYRIEITVEGGRALDGVNAPWDIATASAVGNAIFYPVQYSSAMAAVALGTITAENWADSAFWAEQTILQNGSEAGKYIATVTTTTAAQYLRLGIRAVAGTSVSYKIVSLDVTKMPSGITKDQCAAVTSLSTKFVSNSLVTSFKELALFTGITTINNNNKLESATFVTVAVPPNVTSMEYFCRGNSRLKEVIWSSNLKRIKRECFNAAFRNVDIILPEGLEQITDYLPFGTASSQSSVRLVFPSTLTTLTGGFLLRTFTKYILFKSSTPPTFDSSVFQRCNYSKVYVPDDAVDTYKSAANLPLTASKIYGFSQLEIDYPGDLEELEIN